MKKQMIALFLCLALAFSIVPVAGTEVLAEENVEMQDVDYSYLTTEDALIGHSQAQTRGVYLIDGTSAIRKYSSTKIVAGGNTNAARACKVAVTVMVERYKSGSWVLVTSWTASKASDYEVTTSKILSITTGYKYRVRCYHTAASDFTSSYTSAMQM